MNTKYVITCKYYEDSVLLYADISKYLYATKQEALDEVRNNLMPEEVACITEGEDAEYIAQLKLDLEQLTIDWDYRYYEYEVVELIEK